MVSGVGCVAGDFSQTRQLLLIQLSPWIAAKRLAGNTGYQLVPYLCGASWLPVVVITEGYRRIPKDAEGYRKIPKATESWPEN